MKYTESPDSRKKAVNTGLYVIIGLCLLVIGGASWFAITASSPDEKEPESQSSRSEYSTPSTSYDESVMDPPVISEPMAESVEDQPYSSESEVSSQSASKEKTDVIVFTMPVAGEVLKNHSDTELQFSATFGDMRLHTGVDIAAESGSSVCACADGVVESVELNTTFGNVVTIDHKNGITAKYASLDNIEIESGDAVKAGDIIGTVANVPAECMDKSHLHFEVFKNSKSVEPLKALGLD